MTGTIDIAVLYAAAIRAKETGTSFVIPAETAISLLTHIAVLRDNLEAERQRTDASEDGFWGRACARETQRANMAEAKLANPVVLRKVIEPDDVNSILDSTANPDEYAKCVGSDMWNAAMDFAVRSICKSGFTVKEE